MASSLVPIGNPPTRLMLRLTSLHFEERVPDQLVDRTVVPESCCHRTMVDQRRLPAEALFNPIHRCVGNLERAKAPYERIDDFSH